jgi:hypothetical protein
MIPVRRLARSKRSNSGCSSIAPNIVGTPCSAVQRFFAIERSVSPASKPSPGTPSSPRRGAAQHAEHHAEAVVERHRNAQLVVGAERHRLGAVARVVDDVEVRQRRPFGAPVVPLVNWMLIASSGSSAAESASRRARCAGPASASSAGTRGSAAAPARRRGRRRASARAGGRCRAPRSRP